MHRRFLPFVSVLCLLLSACGSSGVLSPSEARRISEEATVYGSPVVTLSDVVTESFIDNKSPSYLGSPSQFHPVLTQGVKALRGMTPDLPYGAAFIDLRFEPFVVSLPPTEKGRYYSLEIINLYGVPLGAVGTRFDGNSGGNFLIAGPGYKDEKPGHIKRVVSVDTQMALLVFRIQPLGESQSALKKIFSSLKVQPLSKFQGQTAKPTFPSYWPETVFAADTADVFFGKLSFALQYCPVRYDDLRLRADFSDIKIIPGEPYDTSSLSPDIRSAIDKGFADGLKNRPSGPFVLRSYSGDIHTASFIYDSKKSRLDGKNAYVMTFQKNTLPPVRGFWSLSLTDENGRVPSTPPGRSFILSTGLKIYENGEVPIYIQKESPGTEKESNWLPAPDGPFFLVFQGYLPDGALPDGDYQFPPLFKR